MSGYYNRNNRGITKKLGPVTAYADAVLAGYTGTREQWAQDMAKLGQNVTQVAQNTKLTTELAAQTRENTEQVAKDTADVRELAEETSDNAAQVASNTAESNRLAEETKQAAAQAKEDAEYAGAAADNFRVDTTLSEAGKAAEAKTTGEKFAQLSEDILDLNTTVSGGFGNLNKKDLWEQGHFKDGLPGESDAEYYNLRIRTKDFIPREVKLIVALENHLVSVFVYDENGIFIEEFSRITKFLCESGKRYKVQLGISNTKQVTTEIWDKCGLYARETYIAGLIDKIDFDAYKNGYALSLNRNNYWEQGSFKSTGEFSDSTAEYFPLRVRTKNFIPVVDRIVVDEPYELNLFKYHRQSWEFIEELGNNTTYEGSDLEFDKYVYKGQLRNGESPSAELDFSTIDVASIVHFYAEPLDGDKYDKRKNLYIVNAPTCYYSGLMGDNYASFGFSSDTKYDTVISLFDGLVTDHSAVFSKQNLGLSSNNKTICEYAMTPIDGDFATDRKLPKFLIVCAQHGFEKSSVYGLYCFLNDLLNRWKQNPVLEYIRHNIELRFIPIANPYGFDTNSYLNANGVNLNRNYDTPGYPVYPDTVTGDLQYGGETAFDQPETQIIRDWVLSNTDAIILIDHHTQGSGSVSKYTNINWHDYPKTQSDYLFNFRNASKTHIRKITAHFEGDYSLTDLGNNLCGHITGGRGIPSAADLGVWGTRQGIPSMTFEGFNGFVGKPSFTGDVFKANSELIGNWLICVINHMISSR